MLVTLSIAFFSAVLINPTLLDRASIRDSELDAGEDEFTSSPGEEALEGSGRRRLLGGSKWKKRKACPPGLKICLEEEKALAAEKAAKKAVREEEESKQAEELEEASAKVLGFAAAVLFACLLSHCAVCVFGRGWWWGLCLVGRMAINSCAD